MFQSIIAEVTSLVLIQASIQGVIDHQYQSEKNDNVKNSHALDGNYKQSIIIRPSVIAEHCSSIHSIAV